MNLPIVCALISVVAAAPGLLRVPKVYNAVITSNQNLSPSRAFPVIQPVIHRTAVGYVPPFYYTQIAPHFAGPEVVHYPTSPGGKAGGSDQTQASSSSRFVESTSFGIGKDRANAEKENVKEKNDEEQPKGNPQDESQAGKVDAASRKNQQVPLSFYPNYHSLYYEPYIYTYNSFNPHLVPGTYYVDYQPYGSLEPIPPTTPKNHAESGHLLPGFHEERASLPPRNEKEKIPDVPPPPLPTSILPRKS
ncbi:PREDICTED: uncharacterized protein LOC106747592 [Dinoponera quadriceps]|uniref:Uncharacterized protein LOC106747592 n=1 Tax=Dinoponera quadriceps TaxID=609295 RepID=A0A6P3XRN9_DINQU|nr:PREDICTED: uncharacterized protein LOC106747592 [Dinoponera quadriceps]